MPQTRRRKSETPTRRSDTPTAPPEQPRPVDQQQQQPPQQEQEQPSNDQLSGVEAVLKQILDQQQEHRAEVAALREELAEAKTEARAPVPVAPSTEEELRAAHEKEIANHQFYCAACGRLYNRERECVGSGEAPHPALEVISTKELTDGDPSKHTAAPEVRP